MKKHIARPALLLSALAVAATVTGSAPAQAQSVPVLKDQTPQQADQSRAQDRSRAEDVKIGRDWKAQGGENDRAPPTADRDHETIGRDWRAHPDNKDR